MEKLSFSLKLFSGHFYGQSFIKTVQGPLHLYLKVTVFLCFAESKERLYTRQNQSKLMPILDISQAVVNTSLSGFEAWHILQYRNTPGGEIKLSLAI